MECQQCWGSLSQICWRKVHHTHFQFLLFSSLCFSPVSCSQPFGEPKGNLDSLLSVEKNTLFICSIAWHTFWVTCSTSPETVLPIFLFNHDMQRLSGFYNLLTWWVILLLPSQAGWAPWRSSCLASEQNNTCEPMSCADLHEHKLFCHAGNYNTDL